MTKSVLSFDDDNYHVNVKETIRIDNHSKNGIDYLKQREQVSNQNLSRQSMAEKILQDESTARGEIALYLAKAFVWLLMLIIIPGIFLNAWFASEVISIHELLSAFGGIYATVLSFVLGYYFGKDKK